MLLKFEDIENKTVIVEQARSEIGCLQKQKESLKGLGLNGVHTKAELKCTKSVYGMLVKVEHLIKINIKG
jgi:ribosomal protein L30